MNVLTIFGTRPEIIRLSLITRLLDQNCDHAIVHTGQNFHQELSEVFFDELDLRAPDRNLKIRGNSFGTQVGQLFSDLDAVLDEFKPDRILILGDTNSALSSIVAARREIPIYHMEAGNRCFDDRVPEEVNRRIIDHSSTVLLPYSERSKENLLREGIERDRIYVTGNPIYEVLAHYSAGIDSSSVMQNHEVRERGYFLATLHRAENVDNKDKLDAILAAFDQVATEFDKPVLLSVHPRTAEKIATFGVEVAKNIRLLKAMPFFDFVKLEKNAFVVLTDSGTVQEECSIFRVPNVTTRDVTERPETVECGSNIIGGTSTESIVSAVRFAVASDEKWHPPEGYEKPNVAKTVCNIILGYASIRRHR